MASLDTQTKYGKALFEGFVPFDFEKCRLTCRGLSISNSTTGPHFSFSVINTILLGSVIRSHLVHELSLPCTFQFSGPTLGGFRERSGYDAASSGGNGRPIELITMTVNLSENGLSINMDGVAGHIFENDCSSKNQRMIKKNFSVSLIINPSLLPPVIDIRTQGNIFERRFLGTDESSKVFPKIIES